MKDKPVFTDSYKIKIVRVFYLILGLFAGLIISCTILDNNEEQFTKVVLEKEELELVNEDLESNINTLNDRIAYLEGENESLESINKNLQSKVDSYKDNSYYVTMYIHDKVNDTYMTIESPVDKESFYDKCEVGDKVSSEFKIYNLYVINNNPDDWEVTVIRKRHEGE